MNFPAFVKIVEVGPRDGLQNENNILSADTKINFINRLSETGLKVIETTSFVSPKWIPQLADSREVFAGITKHANVQYPVLVPNVKGFEAAKAVGVKEIAVFTTPSEEFSQRNTNCSVQESLNRVTEIIALANQHNIKTRGYISCVLGCPYEGEIDPNKVLDIAKFLVDKGCYEISLGDTIGKGTPIKTEKLISTVLTHIPADKIAVHFHDTFGMAAVNIYVALTLGVAIVDSSVAGLGGCPYAKGATGNVATEDVVYLLEGLGIDTGVNLQKLVAVGRFISHELGFMPHSKVNRALA